MNCRQEESVRLQDFQIRSLGQCLGAEQGGYEPVLEPVLTYQMILPEETTASVILPKLRQLEEEEPELHIIWNEELQEIQVQIMGEVQLEILKESDQRTLRCRCGIRTGQYCIQRDDSRCCRRCWAF